MVGIKCLLENNLKGGAARARTDESMSQKHL